MNTENNKIISKDKLLSSGVHYGHQARSWNAAMKPFIKGVKNGIHIINLDISIVSIDNAYKVVKKIAEKNGTFLFVGTTKHSTNTVKENAERVGAHYINHRWLGGLLTNFSTIQNSVAKLKRLERLEQNGFEGYTKKEALLLKKELNKLEKTLGGIKFMTKLPQAVFVASIRNEEIAIKEAKKMNIPVFGISDTNVSPYSVTFPIFANDDATKSVSLITTIIADAIADVKGEPKLAAFVNDESKFKILGYNENDYVNNKTHEKKHVEKERHTKIEKIDKKVESKITAEIQIEEEGEY